MFSVIGICITSVENISSFDLEKTNFVSLFKVDFFQIRYVNFVFLFLNFVELKSICFIIWNKLPWLQGIFINRHDCFASQDLESAVLTRSVIALGLSDCQSDGVCPHTFTFKSIVCFCHSFFLTFFIYRVYRSAIGVSNGPALWIPSWTVVCGLEHVSLE